MRMRSWWLVGLAGVATLIAAVATRSSWLPPALGGTQARLDVPRAEAPLADPASIPAASGVAAVGAQRELAAHDGSTEAGGDVVLPAPGHVLLQVLDRESGLPLEGEVVARFLSEQRFAEVTTSANLDAALTAGRWTARLHARGYEPLELPEFTIEPALPLDLGQVALARGNGVIEGDVIARHLAQDAPVRVELRGHGRRRCTACLAPLAATEGGKVVTEPVHGCGEGDEPSWFTLTGDRRFRFEQLAEGSYFLRAFDLGRQIVEQRRVEVTRGGYVWQSLEISAPTLARVELRHARGALFSGDWASFHHETPADLEFDFQRDGTLIAQGHWTPDAAAVRASVGEPLVPLRADATASAGEDAANRNAIELVLGRLFSQRTETRAGAGSPIRFVVSQGSPAERLDRARAEGDSLALAASEPELPAAGLEVVMTRPDAFVLAPLPRALLTLTVRCGGYESAPTVLDLRFGETLPCVVPLHLTDRRREELVWIELPVPESCTQCHEQRRGARISIDFGDFLPDGTGAFQIGGPEIPLILPPNADAPPGGQ